MPISGVFKSQLFGENNRHFINKLTQRSKFTSGHMQQKSYKCRGKNSAMFKKLSYMPRLTSRAYFYCLILHFHVHFVGVVEYFHFECCTPVLWHFVEKFLYDSQERIGGLFVGVYKIQIILHECAKSFIQVSITLCIRAQSDTGTLQRGGSWRFKLFFFFVAGVLQFRLMRQLRVEQWRGLWTKSLTSMWAHKSKQTENIKTNYFTLLASCRLWEKIVAQKTAIPSLYADCRPFYFLRSIQLQNDLSKTSSACDMPPLF